MAGQGIRQATALRVALPVAGLLVLGVLVQMRLARTDLSGVPAAVWAVDPRALLMAVLATCLSFWAVGRFDAAVHRHLATGLTGYRVRRTGFAAVAISQTLGFGLITGALVRWRMLPELGLLQATRLTAVMSACFLAAWAAVTAGVIVLTPGAPFQALAGGALCVLCIGAVLCCAAPHVPGRGLHWPNLFSMASFLALAALDCLAAGTALWLLMPAGTSLVALMPVFLLALGAGLVSGTPGGIGAFELTLLALWPLGDDPAVLAAILVWRAVYFIGPAVVAAALAAAPAAAAARAPAEADPPAPVRPCPAGIARPPFAFAEAGLVRQGRLQVLALSGDRALVGRTPHCLTMLNGPLSGQSALRADNLATLGHIARAEARLPVLYKAPPRLAAQARLHGFRVIRLGAEAVLNPQAFSLTRPSRAGLRRKLRRAEGAGVQCSPSRFPPMALLTEVNTRWAQARGGEQGFSMGRFCPDYLAGQSVILAWQENRLVGFASFHASPAEWTLDLLRPAPDAPDGTAHSLIFAALQQARLEGVARLSLAAAPALHGPLARLPLAGRVRGLAQFKQGFDPDWQPRYLAAPGWGALVLAGVDLARAIHRPGPLPRPADGDEGPDYEIASSPVSWQR